MESRINSNIVIDTKTENVTISKKALRDIANLLETFSGQYATIGGSGGSTGLVGPDGDLEDFPPWIWPKIRTRLDQKVVAVAEVETQLKAGWKYTATLQNGMVIVEKQVSILATAIETANKIRQQVDSGKVNIEL